MKHIKTSNKPRTLCCLDFFLSQQLETVEYDVSKNPIENKPKKHETIRNACCHGKSTSESVLGLLDGLKCSVLSIKFFEASSIHNKQTLSTDSTQSE